MRKNRTQKTAPEGGGIDTKILCQLSETASLSERNAALRYFVDESEEVRLEIMRLQSNLIRQKRTDGQQITPELTYSCLVLAGRIAHREDRVLGVKRNVSEAQADEIAQKRAKRFKTERALKGSPKFSRIRVQFFHKIQVLRDEHNYSWAEVAGYLQRHEKFSVTRAYLRSAFEKISADLQLKEEVRHEN